jgi:C_GCAxxG_C_C family probable redox protein
MTEGGNGDRPEAEALIEAIRERARNLYLTRELLCTEAVITALNKGLDGGLTDDQALAMSAPFCVALGESGCLCGALSGAVMASGLLLGNHHPYRHRRDMRNSARDLHDAFKTANGATCCRALTKKVKHDPKAHFRHCADLTAGAAEMAARLVLDRRPELIEGADNGFVNKRQSGIRGGLMRLIRYVFG